METITLRALMVEDSEDDVILLQRELMKGGFDLTIARVASASAMQEALEQQAWDIILSDYHLPGFGAAQALDLLHDSDQDIPFIIVSGTIGEETAVELMRAGAADYVMKGRMRRLVPAVQRELQDTVARREHRLAQAALRESEREHKEVEARFRLFMHDVLAAVTEGKLHLCFTPQELPVPLIEYCDSVPLLTSEALGELRGQSRSAAKMMDFSEERSHDLVTATSEAAMNCIVHAGGGEGRICQGPDTVQVWIEDHGKGIAVEHLPRATLEMGFTTAGTMGFGMKMILQAVDRIWLLTSLTGTTLVLEQDRLSHRPHWMS